MTGRRFRRAAAAAGVILLLGGAAWSWRVWQVLGQAEAESADLAVHIAQATAELRSTRADAELLLDVLGVLDDDELRLIELRDARGAGRSARLVAGVSGFVLLALELPDTGVGRCYQVWVESVAGPPRSGGTFQVNPFGRATLVGSVPIRPGTRVIVTEEAAGGALQPNGEPVLSGA